MKVSAALPTGVAALLFESARSRRRLEGRLAALVEGHGYVEAILPILDYLEPYEALLTPASRGELYRFIDRDGEQLALRADFTPMLARLLAPRLDSLRLPLRLFYRGDVVRYEENRPGSRRELFQMGVELLGMAEPAAPDPAAGEPAAGNPAAAGPAGEGPARGGRAGEGPAARAPPAGAGGGGEAAWAAGAAGRAGGAFSGGAAEHRPRRVRPLQPAPRAGGGGRGALLLRRPGLPCLRRRRRGPGRRRRAVRQPVPGARRGSGRGRLLAQPRRPARGRARPQGSVRLAQGRADGRADGRR